MAEARLFYGYTWDDEQDEDVIPSEVFDIRGQAVLARNHCKAEVPIPYIAVLESCISAVDGEAINIDPATINNKQSTAWCEQLHEFADRNDIDLEEANGPGWFLAPWEHGS